MASDIHTVQKRLNTLDEKINVMQSKIPTLPDIERLFKRVIKESREEEDLVDIEGRSAEIVKEQ